MLGNTFFLTSKDKERLRDLAESVGIQVGHYHSHVGPREHYVAGDGMTSITPDTWFVDLIEYLVKEAKL